MFSEIRTFTDMKFSIIMVILKATLIVLNESIALKSYSNLNVEPFF